MIDLSRDIWSLTDFVRKKTTELQRRLKETGNPIVLTVNGKAEFVIQHVDAYQRLVDAAAQSGSPLSALPYNEQATDAATAPAESQSAKLS
jgi:uncharacterized protein (DUF2236 family)